MTVGLGAFQFMLEKGEREAWFQSGIIILLCAASVTGMLLFVCRELTCDRPAVGGILISALSFYQLSLLSLNIGFIDVFIPQVLQGAGFGVIFVALSTATLSTIEKRN